jgi:DNA-binding response OmpR family regulator
VRKLLIADDSVTIQRVVELTFAGHDIQVVPVGDGDQAIARIPVERPDIVLADIGMPTPNGYEVSAFVKSHRELAHVPVLLLAGAFEPVDDTRAREVRSDGVIVKPFDPRQMVTRVRELLSAPPPPMLEIGVQPEPPVQEEKSLDEYFDRLDHALHARAATKPDVVTPPTGPPEDAAVPVVPTIESVLDTPPAGIPSAEDRAAVQAAEEHLSAPRRLEVTDTLIDDITTRVLERLSRGPLRDAVSAIVRDIVDETTYSSKPPTPNSQPD